MGWLIGGTFGIALWILCLLLGPMALAFDLRILVPLVTHKPLIVSMWHPAVLVCGVLFGRLAIPVALVLWLLTATGVL